MNMWIDMGILLVIYLDAPLPLLLFPPTSSSSTSGIWEFVSRRTTWQYYRQRLCINISSILTTTPPPFPENIVRKPIDQSYHHSDNTTLHLTQSLLISNNKFSTFTAVLKNRSGSTLMYFITLLQSQPRPHLTVELLPDTTCSCTNLLQMLHYTR